MDFIERLSTLHGKQIIIVVVDRLMPLSYLYTTTLDVAQAFMDNIYKLLDLPNSIVKFH